MNIKALPSMGSAFFVAFVLWSRRFAVPLQKESLGGTLGGALVSSAPTKLYCSISCYVGVHLATLVYHLLRWCTTCYVGALETSAPPEGTPEDTNKTLKQMT